LRVIQAQRDKLIILVVRGLSRRINLYSVKCVPRALKDKRWLVLPS